MCKWTLLLLEIFAFSDSEDGTYDVSPHFSRTLIQKNYTNRTPFFPTYLGSNPAMRRRRFPAGLPIRYTQGHDAKLYKTVPSHLNFQANFFLNPHPIFIFSQRTSCHWCLGRGIISVISALPNLIGLRMSTSHRQLVNSLFYILSSLNFDLYARVQNFFTALELGSNSPQSKVSLHWIKPISILYNDEDWPPFNLQWIFTQPEGQGGKWTIRDTISSLYIGYSSPATNNAIVQAVNASEEIYWDIWHTNPEKDGHYQ